MVRTKTNRQNNTKTRRTPIRNIHSEKKPFFCVKFSVVDQKRKWLISSQLLLILMVSRFTKYIVLTKCKPYIRGLFDKFVENVYKIVSVHSILIVFAYDTDMIYDPNAK